MLGSAEEFLTKFLSEAPENRSSGLGGGDAEVCSPLSSKCSIALLQVKFLLVAERQQKMKNDA